MASNNVVLLVEDNSSDVDLMKRALVKCRIANPLVVAPDGEEALDYLFGTGGYAGRERACLPSIVLLDLNLPGVSGLEVLQRIRSDERTRHLPVIILTSSKEEGDVLAGYGFGVNSYVVKSGDFNRFQDALEHLWFYWLTLNQPHPQAS
jgi:CheY-like chemotaxis protein